MSKILEGIEENEMRRAAEAVQTAIELNGLGGAHAPLAEIADRLELIRQVMPADRAGQDMARVISLVGEAAEIAAKYL